MGEENLVKKLIKKLVLDEPGAPNLDAMPVSDLRVFISTATRCPAQLGRELFKDVEDTEAIRKTVDSLHTYASLKTKAVSFRLKGNVNNALAVERTMDEIYRTLPEWGRW